MNNLEYATKKLGWQGGTIHQLAEELSVDATTLLVMPQDKLGELLLEHDEALQVEEPKRSVVILLEIGLVSEVFVFDTLDDAESKAITLANEAFKPPKLLNSWEMVCEFQQDFHTDGYQLIIREEK